MVGDKKRAIVHFILNFLQTHPSTLDLQITTVSFIMRCNLQKVKLVFLNFFILQSYFYISRIDKQTIIINGI